MSELLDKRMIQQAQETNPLILESLYWVLEDAISDGKTELAQSTYDTFLYIGKYNAKVLTKGLQLSYINRLKEIAYELYGNGDKIVRRAEISLRPPISPKQLPFTKEKELQDYLEKHPRVLSDAFNDEVFVKGVEVPTDFDYRCDITAESRTHFYPIELKIGQGNHQVVSQINKYCHYFYRRLRYGFHRRLQGVVVCNGLDAWSINEIRRDGHWCFTISPNNGGIQLEKVE